MKYLCRTFEPFFWISNKNSLVYSRCEVLLQGCRCDERALACCSEGYADSVRARKVDFFECETVLFLGSNAVIHLTLNLDGEISMVSQCVRPMRILYKFTELCYRSTLQYFQRSRRCVKLVVVDIVCQIRRVSFSIPMAPADSS